MKSKEDVGPLLTLMDEGLGSLKGCRRRACLQSRQRRVQGESTVFWGWAYTFRGPVEASGRWRGGGLGLEGTLEHDSG